MTSIPENKRVTFHFALSKEGVMESLCKNILSFSYVYVYVYMYVCICVLVYTAYMHIILFGIESSKQFTFGVISVFSQRYFLLLKALSSLLANKRV